MLTLNFFIHLKRGESYLKCDKEEDSLQNLVYLLQFQKPKDENMHLVIV